MVLDKEVWSDVQFVRECDHQYKPYLFEVYDIMQAKCMQSLALKHVEDTSFILGGLLNTLSFKPDMVDDVYYKNLYRISWFNEG